MIIKKKEWNNLVTTNYFCLAAIAIRALFLYHILGTNFELPLGKNTFDLIPLDRIVFVFGEGHALNLWLLLLDLFQKNFQLMSIVLVVLTFNRRFEKIAFFLLSILCFIFTERFYLITHIADYFYVFIFFHLSLATFSTLNFSKKNSTFHVRQIDFVPFILLRTIVYSTNLMQKITTNWATGTGLSQSLSHTEISRFPQLPLEHPTILYALNFTSILILAVIIVFPFISDNYRKLKLSTSLLCIAYHLGGILFFQLDGISLPFILFEFMLWGKSSESSSTASTFAFRKRTIIAVTILLLGFLNVSERGNHFDRSIALPMGHNWYMFAPPPPVSGTWTFQVTTKTGETKTLDQQGVQKLLLIPDGIRSYKYFYNLRRIDSNTFVESMVHTACVPFDTELINARYSGNILETGLEFEKLWPVFKCD